MREGEGSRRTAHAKVTRPTTLPSVPGRATSFVTVFTWPCDAPPPGVQYAWIFRYHPKEKIELPPIQAPETWCRYLPNTLYGHIARAHRVINIKF